MFLSIKTTRAHKTFAFVSQFRVIHSSRRSHFIQHARAELVPGSPLHAATLSLPPRSPRSAGPRAAAAAVHVGRPALARSRIAICPRYTYLIHTHAHLHS